MLPVPISARVCGEIQSQSAEGYEIRFEDLYDDWVTFFFRTELVSKFSDGALALVPCSITDVGFNVESYITAKSHQVDVSVIVTITLALADCKFIASNDPDEIANLSENSAEYTTFTMELYAYQVYSAYMNQRIIH